MRRATRAAVVLLLLLTLLVGLLWTLQRTLIYLPDPRSAGSAAAAVPGARDVVLTTGDGLELAAWYLPAAGPDDATVLVANGNGGHRAYRAALARALAAEGLGVLLFDYRGYAGNPVSPSEAGLALDVRAARGWLPEEAGFPPERLVYFGESLGCAVVTGLALEHPPAALVLRSPFVDLAAVGSVHYPFLPVRLLLHDRYPVADQVARIEVPTTVVLGAADRIVPPAQSRRVAEAAARLHRLVEVPGADHNDAVLLDGDELVGAVVELAAPTAAD